jgi:hypothetical protein
MTREELIAALEKAEGPSRELDCDIFVATAHSPFVSYYPDCVLASLGGFAARVEIEEIPKYTTSIDAALTLVPEGWALYRINQYHDNKNPAWGWGGTLRNYLTPEIGVEVGESRASLALALCIAALKARA